MTVAELELLLELTLVDWSAVVGVVAVLAVVDFVELTAVVAAVVFAALLLAAAASPANAPVPTRAPASVTPVMRRTRRRPASRSCFDRIVMPTWSARGLGGLW